MSTTAMSCWPSRWCPAWSAASSARFAARLERLLPGNYIAKVERQLAQAGLSRTRRPGAQIAVQLGLAVVGLALVPLLPKGSAMMSTLAPLLLPVMG
ncbi:MAG: hypothetical protein M3066_06350, partial [Actinomycetota bacterium]|nr:hypothetical protein [Actinomycetota bacterium]